MRVVIIGAGVAGLSIGWRLRQAGAEVTILERGQAAHGATWASAGMIAVAGEMGESLSRAAEFARHASALWPGFAKEIEAVSGMGIGYRRCGTLIVARTAEERSALSDSAEAVVLARDEVLEKEPMLAPAIAGGLWAPNDAQVDNRALGQALARAFTAAGGTLSLNEAAIRFEVPQGEVTAVQTPFARYEADAYVIAAGAWSGGFGGMAQEILPPVRPVKGEMIAIAPPPGARMPQHLIRGNGIYLVPRDDRLLIGATMSEAGFDTSITDAAADWLSVHAIALMPALARWQIVERWAGLRPGSPDGLPILGRAALDRLFVASGQFRNGILFAPAIADNMSRLILEHAAPIPAFDPRRFQEGTSVQ